ncbi:MBL fold metallo-hydrolase [Vreelandella nigrificans]|uniref:MBL fold metallo-hydrolase n=1 Tax=Vreelandella nigrificans TaxID=2042704 RepID=A0A2A4HU69_9GAMM|nr:MBL fold metallo-hydrolase [Halomonas nigrificans]PCF97614.1 MBL fold metallo-hydrolase [Halomonas nigrificans]
MLIAICLLAVISVAGIWAFLKHPQFGIPIEGERLALIERSPNYQNGEFRNQVETPMLTEQRSTLSIIIEDFRAGNERLRPEEDIPSLKTDLHNLDTDEDIVIWLGHSSYFVQLAGLRILIDPVFSENAAPIPRANVAFEGTNPYTADDMPDIDYLLVTHDHYDHLDYRSLLELEPKTSAVITSLGLGGYFEHWGYEPERIQEADWYDSFELENGLNVHVLPARHYSRRLFSRNQTLWVSFALETPERQLYFSGDSGYGPHFAEIGERFGNFDLVSLDHGQYDDRWAYIHMTPEEAAQAADELGAEALLPAHVGKFSLAQHAWDEPFQRITTASEGRNYRLATPLIGEPIRLADQDQRFSAWWE